MESISVDNNHHALPSPTLTNPDMILPYLNGSQSTDPSSNQKSHRPPSPPRMSSILPWNNTSENGTSPSGGHPVQTSDYGLRNDRNIPLAQGSNELWAGFGRESVDEAESPWVEFEPKFPITVGESGNVGGRDVAAGVHNAVEDDEDPFSHAALTKQAEQILANAKKRLNNMEGNLSRARHFRSLTPSSSLSSMTSSSEYRRRKGYDVSLAKSRPANPSTSPRSPKGHSRVLSETSVPSTLQTPSIPKEHGGEIKRSSSAMGSMSTSPNVRDENDTPMLDQTRGSQRAVNRSASAASRPRVSLEPLREDGPAPSSFGSSNGYDKYGSRIKSDPTSSNVSLPNLTENDGSRLARSSSTTQMRDLRDQMQDLKGKISSLKQRAQEDSLKRRSLQSLRTPSPFTVAEQWYMGIDNFKPSSNAQAGLSSGKDVRHPQPLEAKLPEVIPIEPRHEIPETGIEAKSSPKDLDDDASVYSDHEEHDLTTSGFDKTLSARQKLPLADPESGSETDSSHGDLDLDEAQIGERHEDRADAFDYQHFFLHSDTRGMRRDSSSSTDSAETTRAVGPTIGHPVPPNVADHRPQPKSPDQTTPKRLGHARQASEESVSTVATFATAAEGSTSGGGEAEDPLVHGRPMAGAWRPDYNQEPGTKDPIGESFFTPSSHPAAAQQPPAPLPSSGPPALEAARPTVSTHASFEASLGSSLQLSRSDEALVESVLSSLGAVCKQLDISHGGKNNYESRMWRGRLEFARRVLDGEATDNVL